MRSFDARTPNTQPSTAATPARSRHVRLPDEAQELLGELFRIAFERRGSFDQPVQRLDRGSTGSRLGWSPGIGGASTAGWTRQHGSQLAASVAPTPLSRSTLASMSTRYGRKLRALLPTSHEASAMRSFCEHGKALLRRDRPVLGYPRRHGSIATQPGTETPTRTQYDLRETTT